MLYQIVNKETGTAAYIGPHKTCNDLLRKLSYTKKYIVKPLTYSTHRVVDTLTKSEVYHGTEHECAAFIINNIAPLYQKDFIVERVKADNRTVNLEVETLLA